MICDKVTGSPPWIFDKQQQQISHSHVCDIDGVDDEKDGGGGGDVWPSVSVHQRVRRQLRLDSDCHGHCHSPLSVTSDNDPSDLISLLLQINPSNRLTSPPVAVTGAGQDDDADSRRGSSCGIAYIDSSSEWMAIIEGGKTRFPLFDTSLGHLQLLGIGGQEGEDGRSDDDDESPLSSEQQKLFSSF